MVKPLGKKTKDKGPKVRRVDTSWQWDVQEAGTGSTHVTSTDSGGFIDVHFFYVTYIHIYILLYESMLHNIKSTFYNKRSLCVE